MLDVLAKMLRPMEGTNMKLETQVVELEPGWLVIKFQGPKPPHESRPFWLHRTLSDWLTDTPDRVSNEPYPYRTMAR